MTSKEVKQQCAGSCMCIPYIQRNIIYNKIRQYDDDFVVAPARSLRYADDGRTDGCVLIKTFCLPCRGGAPPGRRDGRFSATRRRRKPFYRVKLKQLSKCTRSQSRIIIIITVTIIRAYIHNNNVYKHARIELYQKR